jgi:hypothetical protein
MSRIWGCRYWVAACALVCASVEVSSIRASAQGTNISPKAATLLGEATNREDTFSELRQHYRCVFKNTKFTTHTVRLYESFYVNGYGLGMAGVRPVVRFPVRDFGTELYLNCPGRVRPSRGFGYLISSARAKTTSAITNRQSTATVTATRVQDDLSPNALTSFVLARPAGRS